MKNKIISITLYICAFSLIIIYFYVDIFSYFKHTPISRILLLVTIVVLMQFGAYFLIKYNSKYNNTINKINLVIWLVLYIILLLTVTLFDNYFFRNGFLFVKWNRVVLYDYFYNVVNFIPFKVITEFIIDLINGETKLSLFFYNIFGNFLILTPFAFFLPKLFKKQNNLKIFLLTMFIIVTAIEFIQFITLSGTFDVDDYILNISGAYLMFKLLKKEKIKKVINSFIAN